MIVFFGLELRRGLFGLADRIAHSVRILQVERLGPLPKSRRSVTVCQLGGDIAIRRGAASLTIQPSRDAIVCGKRFERWRPTRRRPAPARV